MAVSVITDVPQSAKNSHSTACIVLARSSTVEHSCVDLVSDPIKYFWSFYELQSVQKPCYNSQRLDHRI